MKKVILGAILCGVFFAVSGCASGPVGDKRAPGEPGRKIFQLQVPVKGPVGPSEVWVTVPEHVWDRCHIEQPYPQCAG